MNKLIYVDQQIEELEYNLFLAQDIDLDLSILMTRDIKLNNIDLQFNIIGSSHQSKIKFADGKELIELLSCTDLNNISVKPLLKERLSNQSQISYREVINEEINYQFELEILSLTRDSYQEFTTDYLAQLTLYSYEKDRGYLYCPFPNKQHLAFTSIEYYTNIEEVRWITYHSYPNQLKVAKTVSLLEL